MTKIEVDENDPQRREAWFSAAETLRKAATVGVSGAQVDAFGKPIGFSKEVHKALRAKKIFNRVPKNKTQYNTLTKSSWTPYTDRVNDRRHRWHRTQSEVDLGGEGAEYDTHYTQNFEDVSLDEVNPSTVSKAKQQQQLASKISLIDASKEKAADIFNNVKYEDPKTIYPPTKLPQTTDSKVQFGRGRRKFNTSYEDLHDKVSKADRKATDRFSWNRTSSTVDLENKANNVTWANMKTHTGSVYPDHTNEALVHPTKELGRKKWNKSHKELSEFAPIMGGKDAAKTKEKEEKEPWKWGKKPIKEPVKASEQLFEGPAGTFAFVGKPGELVDRTRNYGTASGDALPLYQVQAHQIPEHKRTRSTWVPGQLPKGKYDTTMNDMFVQLDAGGKSNDRFQWARTSSRVNLTFAEKEKQHTKKRMERVKQELKDVASEYIKSKVEIKPKTRQENLRSTVKLNHTMTTDGQVYASHSQDVYNPASLVSPTKDLNRLGMRANGGLRQKSQVPMSSASRKGSKAYQTSNAMAFATPAEATKRPMIIHKTTLGDHLVWSEAKKA
ncbi:hypothetical protein HOP50_06g46080 [Chloropicon primus]|uniref:Uncharacterized protein n=1 Tax=Chloropicon primus TaxID=1764295 RepID=A0A5B8MNB5_9CHLO|nr:hypothetical protein A3770_06p45840 [Chloropicon primus]UPR01286.1 hypothetical protein HOP50_06g46080 [Chloropicon primus]|eukprot:QDZ22066.1 hypothetical protein A3770_06p45840 [Chloropicon primus]